MDTAKLLSLLDKGALYFSRLDKLCQLDPFEGSYTSANVAINQLAFDQLPNEWKLSQIKTASDWQQIQRSHRLVRESVKQQRQYTFVNSWHVQAYESAAMWSQYLRSQDGIAIQSTHGRLCDCFKNYTDYSVFIGMMRYLDYEREIISMDSVFGPYLSKRRSFEHEKELRCMIWTLENGKNELNNNKFKDVDGIYVPVDLPVLIQKIYIAPTAPAWFRETISAIIQRLGFKIEVCQSDLLASPMY